jgi:hypothetical protein
MTLDLPLKDIEKRKAGRHADVWADIEVTVFIQLNAKGLISAKSFWKIFWMLISLKFLHRKWAGLLLTIRLHHFWV